MISKVSTVELILESGNDKNNNVNNSISADFQSHSAISSSKATKITKEKLRYSVLLTSLNHKQQCMMSYKNSCESINTRITEKFLNGLKLM